MTLQDAIGDSRDGRAIAYTAGGRIAAEVWGPGPWLSKRKRKKMSKGVRITIWTPPRLPPRDDGGWGIAGSTPTRHTMKKISQKMRRFVDSLNWQPAEVRSAIDRLANLITKR